LRFCDEAVEKAIARAPNLDATNPRTANDRWAKVDRMIVDRAPFVPLFNPRRTEFVSARVANYQFNPQLGRSSTSSGCGKGKKGEGGGRELE
jgi:peptide/nickel transport system substrate-binding protein